METKISVSRSGRMYEGRHRVDYCSCGRLKIFSSKRCMGCQIFFLKNDEDRKNKLRQNLKLNNPMKNKEIVRKMVENNSLYKARLGKTYEEMYGLERAEGIIKKQIYSHKGKIPKNLSLINADKKGSRNPMWKGGRFRTTNGYIFVWTPDHPNANPHGYYQEHKLIMEKHLGRILNKQEVVHHIDKDKTNNEISNLVLFPNTGEHSRFHRIQEKLKGGN